MRKSFAMAHVREAQKYLQRSAKRTNAATALRRSWRRLVKLWLSEKQKLVISGVLANV